MKKRIALLLTGLLVLGMVGCGKTAATANSVTSETDVENSDEADYAVPEKVRLACFLNYYQFELAKELGYLDDEFGDDGIEFEYVYLDNGPAVVEAIGAGSLDFGAFGSQPAISGIAAGYDIKIIGKHMDTLEGYPLIARVDSGIDSLADLPGKKVATTYGTVSHFLLLKYIAYAGISLDDFELINTSDATTLLRNGDVDAITSNMFTAPALYDEGTAKFVADGTESGAREVSVIAGRGEFIEQYPEFTARLLKVADKANRWASENPEEAWELLAETSQVDVSFVSSIHTTATDEVNLTDEDIEALIDIYDYLKENDLISYTDIDLNDYIVLDYLEAAGLR